MTRTVRALLVCLVGGLAVAAACSVAPVTFTPLGDPIGSGGPPDAGKPPDPPRVEDCGTPGDEDGNGLADCSDPACAAAPGCQVAAFCGDGHPDPGEACDDGNTANGDGCDNNCTLPGCGNRIVDAGEECDDGNAINGDACDVNCTVPRCGNRIVDPNEDCDTAGAATAACDADCTVPSCGDGQLNLAAGEEADPAPGPSRAVPVNDQTCRFDFSGINQLFCAGTCGTWGGGNGCQQADADAFCKLKTGDPISVATSFTVGNATATPGICCPSVDPATTGCTPLGTFDDRGVALLVSVHETSLSSTHGPGQVITNVICSP
jgi:cysteine-rich repeat protein